MNLPQQVFSEPDLTLPVEDEEKKKLKQSICFNVKINSNLGMLRVSQNTHSIARIKNLKTARLLSKSLLEANVRKNSRHALKIKTQPLSMSHVIDQESKAARRNLWVVFFF